MIHVELETDPSAVGDASLLRCSDRRAGQREGYHMETQRLRDGLVGGVLGSTAGMVALLWWPHASTADTMAVFGAGTVIGLLLGLALGTKVLEWLGVLFDAVS